jgi:hypothetical protein
MITDDEIMELRREAAEAGDMLQVALCHIALCDFDADFYSYVGKNSAREIRRELETRGIIPEHVGAAVLAREECEKAVRS